jgi:uncharacterized lipoprotein YehR (DUF1307 family)
MDLTRMDSTHRGNKGQGNNSDGYDLDVNGWRLVNRLEIYKRFQILKLFSITTILFNNLAISNYNVIKKIQWQLK